VIDLTATDDVLSRVEQPWLRFEEDSPEQPGVAAGIRANGPSGYYSDARNAILVLHGGFKDAARRQRPPKARMPREF
jgi:hypothetical protein